MKLKHVFLNIKHSIILSQLNHCKKAFFFFFFSFKNICLFCLCWVLVATGRLSLVAVSGGCSLPVVHGHLIVVASLVVEHGL